MTETEERPLTSRLMNPNAKHKRLKLPRWCAAPGWHSLRRFGNNRVVKSSYAWLILVPIIAKVLAPLPSPVDLKVFGATLSLNFALPFRWKVLFLMALFYSIGEGIYQLFCPPMVRHFRDFTHFQSEHAGIHTMSRWLMANMVRATTGNRDADRLLGTYLDSFASHADPAVEAAALRLKHNLLERRTSNIEECSGFLQKLMAHAPGEATRMTNDLFDVLQNIDSLRKPGWQIAARVFFIIGMLLFVWIMAETCWFVLNA